MDGGPKRKAACGFCEGTGLWVDLDEANAAVDPCPHCEGTGGSPTAAVAAAAPAAAALSLEQLLAALPTLPQPERQRLYETLHALYDCRIYQR